VQGIVQHFKRPGKVKKIHLVVEGKEDRNGFCGIAALSNCTHLDKISI
jgi:hypothetical protein